MTTNIELKSTTLVEPPTLSLLTIAKHYWGKLSITGGLLVIEAILLLLLPLAIGFAIDSYVTQGVYALSWLAALAVAVAIFGAGRRFYDTRAYAEIYRQLALKMSRSDWQTQRSTSSTSARVRLLTEVVEFFENSLPELVGNIIAFVGILIILANIEWHLLLACGISALLIALVYLLTGNKIIALNKGQNDELEQQVHAISQQQPRLLNWHLLKLMKWNIKLSDLETWSFTLVWLVLASLLMGAIVIVVGSDSISLGAKFTSIMYVFEFIELAMVFPLIYQQILRLTEITQRLSANNDIS